MTSSRSNALLDYLTQGAADGRDPHPLFSTRYYLALNPDVASAGVNPLIHYLAEGASKGRDPHPLFDSRHYASQNPDPATAEVNPLLHYLGPGTLQRRDPHPLFSTWYYLSQDRDIASANVNPLLHYLKQGAAEGRDPHPNFDSDFYLERNPDVADAGLNPLVHYVGPGVAEGRDPNPFFSTTTYLEEHPEVALHGVNPLVHYLRFGTFDLRAALRHELAELDRSPLSSSEKSKPLVSIIILCPSASRQLEDAVLSALLACSHPLEIIVLINRDLDAASLAVVEELATHYKFIPLKLAQVNTANVLLVAIERARGQFIQLLRAVDLLAPGKIDVQIEEFRVNPKLGICISDYEFCDKEGYFHWKKDSSPLYQPSGNRVIARTNGIDPIPIHCALFQKDFLEQSTLEFVGPAEQPWSFSFERLQSHKCSLSPPILAISRMGDGEPE